MKTLIKNELDRSLKNKWFYITILFSTAIVFYEMWVNIIPVRESMDIYIGTPDYPIPNAYGRWMEVWNSKASQLFHFIFPLLACIPYAMTIYTDVESKYFYNIIVRVDKKKYFLSKLLTQFMTGFLIVIFPLMLSFVLTLAILPMGVPLPSMNYAMGPLDIFSVSFYKNPFLTYIVVIILEAILFGIISCLSYTFAYLLKNGIMVMISAFTVYFFESVISPLIGNRYTMILGSYVADLKKEAAITLLIEVAVIIVIVIITYYLRSNAKNEL